MKKAIAAAAFLFALVPAYEAAAGSATAGIGEGCVRRSGSFTVPEGKVAFNLSASVDTGWLPCAGTGHATRAGVRLQGPAGNVIYYYVKTYEGASQVLAGSLAGLVLGPGKYTVEAPDGGLGTTAKVSFELRDAAPPPPAPAATGPGVAGGISGEWSDPTVGSSARITQSGNSMSITNTFTWEGKQVTWNGSGTVSGSSVTFKFEYSGYRPEGWEGGTMKLERTNSRTLSGSWTTSSGKYSNPITFILKRADEGPQLPAAKKPPAQAMPAAGAASPAAQRPVAPPAKRPVCPPGQIYEEHVGCTPHLRVKEER